MVRRRATERAPERRAVAALAVTVAMMVTSAARAQQRQEAQGFAVERLYLSAPGAGWFVMDDLDMHGPLGGVIAVTGGYAYQPLRLSTADGSQHLTVVSDEALTDIGFAATYDRYRLYLNASSPVLIDGNDGSVGAYHYFSPHVDLGQNPDLISDVRFGFDARLLGDPGGPFRLGAGAQLFVPNGNQADYDSDGTFRAMLRVLFAGDAGLLSYAGQVGVHVRPLDASPAPAPQGSELLFGLAAGPRFALSGPASPVVVVGPELFGETAFRSFFGSNGTGLEGLLSARVEGTGDGPQIRVKLGGGGGIDPHFGAPEWRAVVGFEVFDRTGPATVVHANSAAPTSPR